MKQYYVYIMASYRKVIYIGITSDLARRVYQHKTKSVPDSFTAKYNVTSLVHVETYTDVRDAIAREKQLKGWRRSKKVELIEKENPEWRDLSQDWM